MKTRDTVLSLCLMWLLIYVTPVCLWSMETGPKETEVKSELTLTADQRDALKTVDFEEFQKVADSVFYSADADDETKQRELGAAFKEAGLPDDLQTLTPDQVDVIKVLPTEDYRDLQLSTIPVIPVKEPEQPSGTVIVFEQPTEEKQLDEKLKSLQPDGAFWQGALTPEERTEELQQFASDASTVDQLMTIARAVKYGHDKKHIGKGEAYTNTVATVHKQLLNVLKQPVTAAEWSTNWQQFDTSRPLLGDWKGYLWEVELTPQMREVLFAAMIDAVSENASNYVELLDNITVAARAARDKGPGRFAGDYYLGKESESAARFQRIDQKVQSKQKAIATSTLQKSQGTLSDQIDSIINALKSYRKQIPEDIKATATQKLIDAVQQHINSLPDDVVKRIPELQTLAQTANIKNLPPDIQQAVRAAITQEIVATSKGELDNHTIVRASLMSDKPDAAIAYQQELATWSIIPGMIDAKSPLRVDIAKRIVRLEDYIESYEARTKGRIGKAWQTVKGALTGYLSDARRLAATDATFESQRALKKAYLQADDLYALPEDMLAQQAAVFDEIRMALKASDKSSERMKQVTDLETLIDDLRKPKFIVADGQFRLQDLLIGDDVVRFDKLQVAAAGKLVSTLKSIVDDKTFIDPSTGLLGDQSAKRLESFEELKRISDLLATETFKAVAGADKIREQLNAIITHTEAADVREKDHLMTQKNELVDRMKKAAANDMKKLAEQTAALSDKIERIAAYSTLSSEGKADAFGTAQELRAWNAAATLIDALSADIKAASAEQLEQAFSVALYQTAAMKDYTAYQLQDNPRERWDLMGRQGALFEKTTELMRQQKVDEQDMVELGRTLQTVREALKQPEQGWVFVHEPMSSLEPKTRDALVVGGFVEEKKTPSGGVLYELTRKGYALADITRAHDDINARATEIKVFLKGVKDHGDPTLAMKSAAGRSIPLATQLKVNWMIPSDVTRACSDVYRMASRDPSKVLAVEAILDKTVSSVRSAVDSLVETFKDPEFAATLGIAADGLKAANIDATIKANVGDESVLAKALGIELKDEDLANKNALAQKIAAAFNITDPKQIKALKDRDTRVQMLQRALLTKLYTARAVRESAVKPGAPGFMNREQLQDLSAIIDEQATRWAERQKKQWGDDVTNWEPFDGTYLKALIESKLQNKPLDDFVYSMSEILTGNIRAVLGIEPLSFGRKILENAREAVHVFGDFFTAIPLFWQKKVSVPFKMKLATFMRTSSVVAGVTIWLALKINPSLLTDVLSTAAVVAGGVVAGPGGIALGLATKFAIPQWAIDAVGVSALIVTPLVGYWLADKVQPKPEYLESLNEQLQKRGWDTLLVPDPSFASQVKSMATDYVTNTFKPRFEVWSKQKQQHEERLTAFLQKTNTAREDYYRVLGLDPKASDADLQKARAERLATIQTSWAPERWLLARRMQRAERYMLVTAQEALRQGIVYHDFLTDMAQKALADPAARNQQVAARYYATEVWNWMKSWTSLEKINLSDIVQKGKEPEGFTNFWKGSLDYLGRVKIYLEETQAYVNKNAESLVLGKDFLKVYNDLVNNILGTLETEAKTRVAAVLKIHGYDVPIAQAGNTEEPDLSSLFTAQEAKD